MNGRLSSSTKALLEAARADAPSASAKAKMWSGVVAASGPAGAGGAAEAGARTAGSQAATGGGGLGGATIFGGVLVVGLAAVLLRVLAAPQKQEPVLSQLATTEVARGTAVPLAAAAAEMPSVSVTIAVPAFMPTGSSPQTKPAPAPGRNLDDALDREASLVAEARSALLRGDPRAALQKIRAARAIPSGELAPEELSIEAQSLRALGRSGAADDADAKLRSTYPESALAR